MINPAAIPQITGDMGALRAHASEVSGVGTAFPDTGRRVNATWQGLGAVYSAPEAGDLLVATAPVQTVSASVGEDLTAVGSALSTYATEVAAIQTRLETLRTQATAFVQSVANDPDWHKSQSKVDEHNGLIRSVDAAVADFMDAQRRCANSILALYSGKRFSAENGDGTVSDTEFGYTAAQLDGAMGEKDALPWGSSEEHDRGFLGDVGSFFTGIGDGAKGFVSGLGALIGYSDGHWTWGTAGTAWKGLGTFALALGVYGTPGGVFLDQTVGVPGFDKGQLGDTLLGAGKALIAYDEWGKDKSHAAGMATFNVLSAIIGTKGAGAGLRAGGAALEATEIAGVARVGTAALRVGDFVGRLPTVTDVVGQTLRRFPGLHIPHIDVPGVDVPTVHVDVPHTPHVTTPHLTTDGPTVGDALPHTPHVDAPGTHVHVDAPGTHVHVDAPGTPAHVDAPGTPAHVDAPGTPIHADAPRVHSNIPGVHADAPGVHADAPGVHTDNPGGHHDTPGTHPDTPDSPIDSATPHPGVDGTHPDTPGGHSDPAAVDPPPPPGDHSGPPAHPAPDLPPGMHPSDLGTRPDGSWVGVDHGTRLDLDHGANAAADDLLHRAAQAEPTIRPEIQAIAGHEPGARMLGEDFALKGEDSLKRKLATELYDTPDLSPTEAASQVRDSVRYTIELPPTSYVDGVERAVAQMHDRGFVNVAFKPSWDAPGGYKGVNTNWLDPRTGQVFELQFHTADSFAAKMQTHDLYEQMRLPTTDDAERLRLAAEQQKIFSQVAVPDNVGHLHDIQNDLAHQQAATEPAGLDHGHAAPTDHHTVDPPGIDHGADHSANQGTVPPHDPGTAGDGTTEHPVDASPPGVHPDWLPRTADNGAGVVYQQPGAVGNADMLRIMDPTPRYPNGYVRFYNHYGQPIDLNGKPGSRADTHIPRAPDGTYDTPTGW